MANSPLPLLPPLYPVPPGFRTGIAAWQDVYTVLFFARPPPASPSDCGVCSRNAFFLLVIVGTRALLYNSVFLRRESTTLGESGPIDRFSWRLPPPKRPGLFYVLIVPLSPHSLSVFLPPAIFKRSPGDAWSFCPPQRLALPFPSVFDDVMVAAEVALMSRCHFSGRGLPFDLDFSSRRYFAVFPRFATCLFWCFLSVSLRMVGKGFCRVGPPFVFQPFLSLIGDAPLRVSLVTHTDFLQSLPVRSPFTPASSLPQCCFNKH